MDRKLIDILCCPVSKAAVHPLDNDRLAKLNRAIEAGSVKYVNHDPVNDPLDEALITEGDKVIYRVDDNIPVMLADRGIGTAQLNDF
jgi:uncharacterized protein YbaR (Trm112 family)